MGPPDLIRKAADSSAWIGTHKKVYITYLRHVEVSGSVLQSV